MTIRFSVTNMNEFDTLNESIRATWRAWKNGDYTIEELELRDNMIGWCDYFMNLFSVCPCPVFWKLSDDEAKVLRFIIEKYCTETLPVFERRHEDNIEIAKTLVTRLPAFESRAA